MEIMASIRDAIVEKLKTNYVLVLGIAVIAGLIYRKGRLEYHRSRGIALIFSENGSMVHHHPGGHDLFSQAGVNTED